MSKLKIKLAEINCNKKRELIINNFEGDFLAHLKKANYDLDRNLFKNLAYPRYSENSEELTTFRGTVSNWEYFEFDNIDDIKVLLGKVNFGNKSGWFSLFFRGFILN